VRLRLIGVLVLGAYSAADRVGTAFAMCVPWGGDDLQAAALGRKRSEHRRAVVTQGEVPMEIVRNADGTLVVPVQQDRRHGDDDGADAPTVEAEAESPVTTSAPTTRVLHPGEGGYDEALAEWDLQQNPDREPVVSTATGRQEAMRVVHTVATSPVHSVTEAVEGLADPEASGEALRHVLVGGVPSVEGFAAEVAEAEGGDPLPAHETTKIIGEVLTELD